MSEKIIMYDDIGRYRDICRARKHFNTISISSRGIGYVTAFDKQDFLVQCKKGNIEFLPPNEWIKIESDKDLPAQGISLLFRIKDSQYTYAGYLIGNVWVCLCGHKHHLLNEATHWMPIPQAPKE